MRPIQKPNLPAAEFTHPVDALLMQTLGEYCQISERRLRDVAYVWNKRSGKVLTRVTGKRETSTPPIRPSEWPNVLLLDQFTYEAQQRFEGQNTSGLLLPDDALTFTLGESSPFVYELEKVERTFLDEEGNPDGPPEAVELATVRGTTDAARATIAYFALNTVYYDAERKTFQIPREDALSLVDPRVDKRTEMWHMVEQFSGLLKDARQNQRVFDALVRNGRMIASEAGHWSVWATVLWNNFQDRELVGQVVLQPERERQALMEAAGIEAGVADRRLGPGPHNVYPGTRRDWLTA